MSEIGRFRWPEPGEISSADLLRECGQRLTDRALWGKFQDRFQRLIFSYLMRTLRYRGINDDISDTVPDLAQDVYMRLVQNDGRRLRAFRGTTEFSACAFMARVCANVVADHFRYNTAEKRGSAVVVPIDHVVEREAAANDRSDFVGSIVSWIDVESVVNSDQDQKHAARNLLILKLFYIDGLTAHEIAQYRGFDLTEKGVETVLARMKTRLRKRLQK
jgi:RNA polymerase sigma factor (sigma-70 family)